MNMVGSTEWIQTTDQSLIRDSALSLSYCTILILAKLCDLRPLFDVEHLTHELWHGLQFFMEIGENLGMSGGGQLG